MGRAPGAHFVQVITAMVRGDPLRGCTAVAELPLGRACSRVLPARAFSRPPNIRGWDIIARLHKIRAPRPLIKDTGASM